MVWESGSSSQVKMCTRYQYCESSSLLLISHFTSFQYRQLELVTLWHKSANKLLYIDAPCSLCCDKHSAMYKPASYLLANLCIFFQNTGILKQHLQDQKHCYTYIATTWPEQLLNLPSSLQPQLARAKGLHHMQRMICMKRPLSLRSKTWAVSNSFLQINL